MLCMEPEPPGAAFCCLEPESTQLGRIRIGSRNKNCKNVVAKKRSERIFRWMRWKNFANELTSLWLSISRQCGVIIGMRQSFSVSLSRSRVLFFAAIFVRNFGKKFPRETIFQTIFVLNILFNFVSAQVNCCESKNWTGETKFSWKNINLRFTLIRVSRSLSNRYEKKPNWRFWSCLNTSSTRINF